jgi:hypothetical protein
MRIISNMNNPIAYGGQISKCSPPSQSDVATPRYYWLLPSRDGYEERGIGTSEPKVAVAALLFFSPPLV